MEGRKLPLRKDGRVIIHFDYDCFYASVFEAKNPSLKSLPFAVQQKQIIVTCNYEARRRGLHKLMLIKDAKRVCPDVIIELGEDISRFRDASKELYNFIREYSWNGKIEKLGFDEVWFDATDMVDYNMESINRNDLTHSFFQTSRDDPVEGFDFDASTVAGHTYPKGCEATTNYDGTIDDLALRLSLGSHLALFMRHHLEQQKGYTSTVGIASNKLLSKLVGNVNKPKGQTTLMPPLDAPEEQSSVLSFVDNHEIGKVPGIGFKLAQILREFILKRVPAYDFIYGGTHERVSVADVRKHPEINFEELEKLLGGPGSPHGIGYKVWCLLHGIDDTDVSQARPVPKQISIEDSYKRLDNFPQIVEELLALTRSLITRMRVDLLGDNDGFQDGNDDAAEKATNECSSALAGKRWLAHPKTLRLSTRPRMPLLPDGTRARTMKRISHSCPLPSFVFNLSESIESLAEKLVHETVIIMFRRLHPEKVGLNLSLVNVAVTNMMETAGESKTASGRHIGSMLKRQEHVLKDFRVTDTSPMLLVDEIKQAEAIDPVGLEAVNEAEAAAEEETGWDDGDEMDAATEFCYTCGTQIPSFAMIAHQRFHAPGIR